MDTKMIHSTLSFIKMIFFNMHQENDNTIHKLSVLQQAYLIILLVKSFKVANEENRYIKYWSIDIRTRIAAKATVIRTNYLTQ